MAAQDPTSENGNSQQQGTPVMQEGPVDIPINPQNTTPPSPQEGFVPQQVAQPQTPTQTEVKTEGPPPPPKKKFSLNKKTILIVVGVLVLLVVLFLGIRAISSGLGGGGDKKLTWWGLWEDESIVTPLIQEYEEQNPGVEIEYVKQSHRDYRERITNALARGEGPDIFRFHNTWVPMFRQELDTVPASVMTPAEFVETYYPVASRDLSSGSGLVGIPLEYDGLTLFINEDIFSAAGKTAPETWDDLRQAGCNNPSWRGTWEN